MWFNYPNFQYLRTHKSSDDETNVVNSLFQFNYYSNIFNILKTFQTNLLKISNYTFVQSCAYFLKWL